MGAVVSREAMVLVGPTEGVSYGKTWNSISDWLLVNEDFPCLATGTFRISFIAKHGKSNPRIQNYDTL